MIPKDVFMVEKYRSLSSCFIIGVDYKMMTYNPSYWFVLKQYQEII